MAAVLQSDGYEYLRESCPSLQCELLKAVAGIDMNRGIEETFIDCKAMTDANSLDGSDENGRRVRQRV